MGGGGANALLPLRPALDVLVCQPWKIVEGDRCAALDPLSPHQKKIESKIVYFFYVDIEPENLVLLRHPMSISRLSVIYRVVTESLPLPWSVHTCHNVCATKAQASDRGRRRCEQLLIVRRNKYRARARCFLKHVNMLQQRSIDPQTAKQQQNASY